MVTGVDGGVGAERWARASRRWWWPVAATVAIALGLGACGSGVADEPAVVAPGIFETLATDGYEPAASLAELADRSDRVVIGTIVDVEEGWRRGDGPDDPEADRLIELIVEAGELDGPLHVVWPYVRGYSIEEIRATLPLGAPVVVYLVDFRAVAKEPGWYHVGPDDEHTHWMLTTPQGIVMAEPETGTPIFGDPSKPFSDAPPADAAFDAWRVGEPAVD